LTPIASDYVAKNLLAGLVTDNDNYTIGTYHSIPQQDTLVKDLDNFPKLTPLTIIQLNLKKIAILKSITIKAFDVNGTMMPGGWTTQPDTNWGIGIFGSLSENSLINNGKRREDLNLPIGQKLSLLIAGDLPKCAKLYIELSYSDRSRDSSVAYCK
jgi:hypothetical protein